MEIMNSIRLSTSGSRSLTKSRPLAEIFSVTASISPCSVCRSRDSFIGKRTAVLTGLSPLGFSPRPTFPPCIKLLSCIVSLDCQESRLSVKEESTPDGNHFSIFFETSGTQAHHSKFLPTPSERRPISIDDSVKPQYRITYTKQ